MVVISIYPAISLSDTKSRVRHVTQGVPWGLVECKVYDTAISFSNKKHFIFMELLKGVDYSW